MKKKLTLTIALSLGITYSTVAPTNTYAKESIGSKINSVKSEQAAQQSAKSQVLAQEQKLSGELNKLNNQMLNMTGKVSEKQVDINETKDDIKNLKADISKTKKALKKRENYLKERAKTYYVNGNTSFLDVIFNSDSFGDLIERAFAMKQITENDQKIINKQKADKKKLENDQAKLQKNLEASVSQMDDLQGMLVKIETMHAQKQKAADVLNSKAASIDDRLSDLKDAEAALSEEKTADKHPVAAAAQDTNKEPKVTKVSTHENASSDNSSRSSVHHSSHKASKPNPKPESHESDHSTTLISDDVATGGISGIINAGKKYIGHSRYEMGRGRSASDIANGVFDCSAFVSWAFRANGINLGGASTEALKNVGQRINSKGALKPGDLVFFDTYKTNGHVGIYMGGGQFIGAQDSTGVAIVSMSNSWWAPKFNHAQRVLGN
ncbi:peptidoglycan hydrolase CwlO-like protein [Scopulibacillus darangshiensis]|uniref:Peptidoglycan hydrolase CwlO-like protein n=1 Tax=Scopulibacillus darangshiensis TaxID=442528 RepID=A0A4R2P6R5_9BACL|nr:C40 family peptidase [Scopulibacillus darangshiensis]TCP30600.1 peptidoglycan hydrolase CwlO-like protein [Scopulibacillus darangshiensis]